MNNWDYNEVTQSDLYDFKACKHNKTGKIYGIKESASCQQGKEVDKAELNKMVKAANAGDPAAKKAVEEWRKADKESKQETAKAKKEDEKKKKEAEAQKGKKGGKGKKGKGGKGKKGGGKGKGGKGGGGGSDQGEARKKAQETKAAAAKRARETVQRLQKMMREVSDPKARQQIQKAIGDLMKSVVEATRADMGVVGEAGKLQGQIQGASKKES